MKSQFMSEYSDWIGRRGTWADFDVISEGKLVHPKLFWETFSDVAPILSEVAVRLFSFMSSAACGERLWKVMAKVQSKSRPRLSDKKAERQAFVSYNNSREHKPSCTSGIRRSTFEKVLASLFFTLFLRLC